MSNLSFISSIERIEKRKAEVSHIEKDIPQEIREGQVVPLKKIEDDVINRFWIAINLYYLDLFEESIIKSSLAVEIAVAIQLNKQFTDKEKATTKRKSGMTFGGLISKLDTDQTTKELLTMINNVRNCYIHYYTLLVMVKKTAIDMQPLAMEQNIDRSSEFGQVVREFGKYLNKPLADIPDFSWCASDKSLKFINERMGAHLTNIDKYIESLTDEDVAKIRTLQGYRDFWANIHDKFDPVKTDCLAVLNWSHKALRALGIF